MSTENVILFYEKIQEDHQFRNQLENVIAEEQKNFTKKIVKLGKEHGLDFTAFDFEELIIELTNALKNDGELVYLLLEEAIGKSMFSIAVGVAISKILTNNLFTVE